MEGRSGEKGAEIHSCGAPGSCTGRWTVLRPVLFLTGMSENTGLQLRTGLCSPHPNASDVPSRSYRPLSKIPQSTNHDSMNGKS